MTSRQLVIAFDAHDPAPLARFWADVLDRIVVQDARGALVPGGETQLSLRFVPGPTPKTGPNLVHLHLTSTDLAELEHTVATALRLGGSHLDVGQRPEEGHVVLADPEGNEFCVIPPGNAFLAGCGFLGEIACDGGREAGLFWSEALEWPLVWDQDEETAIQSPRGGTKVAWGGPTEAPNLRRSRQRFDLVTMNADQSAEMARLVALGARLLEVSPNGVASMADPGDTEFRLVAG